MRGKAYGSDEAENWPQSRTGSMGGRKRKRGTSETEAKGKRGKVMEGKAAFWSAGLSK